MTDYTALRGLVLHAANQDRAGADMDLDTEGDAAWLDQLTGLELGDMLAEAERLVRAARFVKARVDEALLRNVEMDGRIRLGDYGYYAGTKTVRRLRDPDGLLDFLHDQGGREAVRKAVRLSESNVRISVVRGIAAENGVDPKAVEDSFFETTYGEKELKKVPAGQAKWVEDLSEGERA